MSVIRIPVQPLSRDAFAPFGDVIETEGARHYPINAGHAERYHDLAKIECTAEGGRPLLNIFRAKPFPLPLRVQLMERHPLSSQAFMPMSDAKFLVIVAERSKKPESSDLRAFLTNGRQGINYRPGTWHHPLVSLSPADYLIVDRQGPGEGRDQDYDEVLFKDQEIVVEAPAL
jgi:ureidoglycolate lyase